MQTHLDSAILRDQIADGRSAIAARERLRVRAQPLSATLLTALVVLASLCSRRTFADLRRFTDD